MVEEDKLKPDVATFNLLIWECENITSALELLKTMISQDIKPNVYTYTTLMSIHRKYEDPNNASEELKLFQMIEDSDLKPDVISINQLIGACVRNGSWDQAWAIFSSMRVMGIQPNVRSYNCILAACHKCNKWDQAVQMFRQLKQDKERYYNTGPNLVTYNTLISVFAKTRRNRLALQYFDQMQDDGIQPDAFTLSSLIVSFPTQKWQDAVHLFEHFVINLKVVPSVAAYNSLLTLLGKAGMWYRTVALYKYMISVDVEPDVYTFSALIKGCERADQFDLAIKLFDEMLSRKVTPNVYVFGAALVACERGNQWDKAVEVFTVMQYFGVELDTMAMFARKLIYAWPPLMGMLPNGLVRAAQVTINSGRAVRRWIDEKIQ
eukprot:TRINITY_DN56779_c0_g1_i4.p1 TRINITY_DN56779_c0_g1~~TRINITY_DN56779_c0_g1_i4.p1  ORF type:complete len:378 (-),score=36.93 TRINITY_DN56779_c0_g1_i4:345-1478(-)